ncbi:hypothetical protein AB0A69_01580 [Streptomyces sp. NPDC045431]|uniref:hypothetical protein n=1 Tax=Streptomyces sp. NPDC045431 TaxID=3155613 RepID=UPI0034036EBA
MNIELLPRDGAGPFRLGLSVEEARQTARELGHLTHRTEGNAEPGQIVLTHEESGFDLVLGFTRGLLSQVELWRFRNEDADVRVTLEAIDVFRTPHEELQQRLVDRGYAVEENDLGFDAVPDLGIIFANESSYEYPTDEEGDPLYYDYVLVSDETRAR